MGFWTWSKASVFRRCAAVWRRAMTYADGGEDILKLVDERNQAWVIDIYAAHDRISQMHVGARAQEPYAVGFAVMVGGELVSGVAESV